MSVSQVGPSQLSGHCSKVFKHVSIHPTNLAEEPVESADASSAVPAWILFLALVPSKLLLHVVETSFELDELEITEF